MLVACQAPINDLEQCPASAATPPAGKKRSASRQRIATPWLAALAPEQTLLHQAAHDMRGLAQYSAGNGIQTQWQRSSHPHSWGTPERRDAA